VVLVVLRLRLTTLMATLGLMVEIALLARTSQVLADLEALVA
jgi:hypothetical protein